MGKVSVNALPYLAESLGMENTTDELIPDEGQGDGCSLKDLLNRLCMRYRHFEPAVFDRRTQTMMGDVVIFLNGRTVALLEGLETKLIDGDVLTLIRAIEAG
jgi:molybdopterin converting factor small subunit